MRAFAHQCALPCMQSSNLRPDRALHLRAAGALEVVSSNTVAHQTNTGAAGGGLEQVAQPGVLLPLDQSMHRGR